MLVLTRKAGEEVVIPGCQVTFTVLKVTANRVRIGVSAPPHVSVHRHEVWQGIEADMQPAHGDLASLVESGS